MDTSKTDTIDEDGSPEDLAQKEKSVENAPIEDPGNDGGLVTDAPREEKKEKSASSSDSKSSGKTQTEDPPIEKPS